MKPDIIDVLEFIKRRFDSDRDNVQNNKWMNGNCYYFALILKNRFKDGFIVYDTILGHFMFLYDNYLIDAISTVKLKSFIEPDENNYIINDTIVVWDYFKLYDEYQYHRIVRDCIE